MNNIYFIVAPSGSGKTSICNLLKEKCNITFDNYDISITAEQVETHDLYVIDPKGVDYFMKSYNGSKTAKVIYIDSDIITRYNRMRSRAEESGKSFIEAVDSALKRIGNDINEFYDYCFHTASVDFYVDNNDSDTIDKVADKVYAYICECERR